MERVQETAGRRNVTGGFSAGAKKSLPVIIGMVPSAMAFGILAKTAGLSIWESLFMSAVVFAGASQFAALCVDAQPGQQVLDLCAAPGGKSLTLAEAMQDKGQLVSGEFVPARVPLLQQAFDRCGITCAVAVENDATQHNSDWPTFDRVLCDVPCSGLGVIAKKPDIRYKDLDGIENLLAAQQKILQNGADSLAENGRLVYSTCTVNDKENQAQVEKFLSANPDFHVVLPETAVPGADITPLGTLFLPHRTGTDGFFAAILERN